MISAVHFWMFLGAMAFLMIWQQIYFSLEIRRQVKANQDLLNRLQARDLQEYAGATRAINPVGSIQADNTEEWTDAEKEQALDRIPIN